MYSDVVFPDGNEEEFIEMAKKLGYGGLFFIYPIEKLKKNESITKGINIKKGSISDIKNFQKAKRLTGFVIVKGSKNDRHVLEKLKPSILFDLESGFQKDFMHHRASGLNQVLCKIAEKNKVAIGFSISSDSKILGRIRQNIRLCRKYKVKTIIASFAKDPYEMRPPHDLIAMFICLGMHPSEAKNSLSF